MRTIVIGDIHGSYQSLKSGLTQIGFNPSTDRIICLGDYIDGWGEPVKVIKFLIDIQNQSQFENIYILGNHDSWLIEVLEKDFPRFREEDYIKLKYKQWIKQGGEITYHAFLELEDAEISRLKSYFLDRLRPYYIEDNKLFVHAGFDSSIGFEESLRVDPESLQWDRSLFEKALNYSNLKSKGEDLNNKDKIGGFAKIYIGHTPTVKYAKPEPSIMGNIINLDQGCKINGRLTLWEDNTDSFIQTAEIKKA